MANKHAASLAKLERELKTLAQALDDLGDGAPVLELIRIIHGPGWTTIAEWMFVHGIVESLTAQVQVMQDLKSALLEGSQRVGSEQQLTRSSSLRTHAAHF